MSLSSDRRRYSNGGGLFFAVFGIIFSTTGVLGLYACGACALELLGVVQPSESRKSIGEYLLGILALLAIGGGHLACGTVCLWTLRTTLDRGRDLVIVRSGWLGCRCRRRRLSEFRSVAVLPGRGGLAASRDDPWFDIALVDTDGASLVIGNVTRSYDLALTVAGEMAQFAHLPAVPSHAAAVDFRHARASHP